MSTKIFGLDSAGVNVAPLLTFHWKVGDRNESQRGVRSYLSVRNQSTGMGLKKAWLKLVQSNPYNQPWMDHPGYGV